MQSNQGIWANGSDKQQREYYCLNLKKCDERTDEETLAEMSELLKHTVLSCAMRN